MLSLTKFSGFGAGDPVTQVEGPPPPPPPPTSLCEAEIHSVLHFPSGAMTNTSPNAGNTWIGSGVSSFSNTFLGGEGIFCNNITTDITGNGATSLTLEFIWKADNVFMEQVEFGFYGPSGFPADPIETILLTDGYMSIDATGFGTLESFASLPTPLSGILGNGYYHVAYTIVNNITRYLFINGQLWLTGTHPTAWPIINSFRIAAIKPELANGLDEVRLLLNRGLYTSEFIPPRKIPKNSSVGRGSMIYSSSDAEPFALGSVNTNILAINKNDTCVNDMVVSHSTNNSPFSNWISQISDVGCNRYTSKYISGAAQSGLITPISAVFDESNNSYVLFLQNNATLPFTVKKFNATGVEQWSKNINYSNWHYAAPIINYNQSTGVDILSDARFSTWDNRPVLTRLNASTGNLVFSKLINISGPSIARPKITYVNNKIALGISSIKYFNGFEGSWFSTLMLDIGVTTVSNHYYGGWAPATDGNDVYQSVLYQFGSGVTVIEKISGSTGAYLWKKRVLVPSISVNSGHTAYYDSKVYFAVGSHIIVTDVNGNLLQVCRLDSSEAASGMFYYVSTIEVKNERLYLNIKGRAESYEGFMYFDSIILIADLTALSGYSIAIGTLNGIVASTGDPAPINNATFSMVDVTNSCSIITEAQGSTAGGLPSISNNPGISVTDNTTALGTNTTFFNSLLNTASSNTLRYAHLD